MMVVVISYLKILLVFQILILKKVHKKLKHLELLDYINCLVTSEEVGIEKPNEDMFNRIIKKTKFKTNDILMIGDSFDNDIIGSIQSNIYSGYLNKSNSIGKKYFSFS